MAQTRNSKKKRLLKLGFLDNDEGVCAETLGDAELAHGEFEGPVDGSDGGLGRRRTSGTPGLLEGRRQR